MIDYILTSIGVKQLADTDDAEYDSPDAARWRPPEGTKRRRPTKAERRVAKRRMLDLRRGKRLVKRRLGSTVNFDLPDVPDGAGIGEWVRLIRESDDRVHTHIKITVPMRVTCTTE